MVVARAPERLSGTPWALLRPADQLRDWSREGLCKTYIQLSEAEAALRIHKNDLSIRPIWHAREEWL